MQPADDGEVTESNAAERLRIVLVGTTHPGNIGAAARAMKVMGVSRLNLVSPQYFPHAEATAMAAGADDILARATVCQDLDEALAGCQLVLGASARLRTVSWPVLDARAAAQQSFAAAAGGQQVAILFGREHSGLTNEELDRCQGLLHIPANAAYSSLNLAAAVQVVCYEWRMAALAGRAVPHEAAEPWATAETLEGFYRQLEQTLEAVGFLDPANPRLIMRRLRRLYHRARLEQTEVNILRGILTETQKRLRGG